MTPLAKLVQETAARCALEIKIGRKYVGSREEARHLVAGVVGRLLDGVTVGNFLEVGDQGKARGDMTELERLVTEPLNMLACGLFVARYAIAWADNTEDSVDLDRLWAKCVADAALLGP